MGVLVCLYGWKNYKQQPKLKKPKPYTELTGKYGAAYIALDSFNEHMRKANKYEEEGNLEEALLHRNIAYSYLDAVPAIMKHG